MDISGIDWEIGDWRSLLSQDRAQWQALLNTVMNLWVS
jgi:hypothetical protein